jgi:hypothetical protein
MKGARILSAEILGDVLDAVALNYSIRDAMATVNASQATYWEWKRRSRIALDELDFKDFYIPWRGKEDFFHCHLERAIASLRHPVSGRVPFPIMSEMERELQEKAPKPRPMTDMERDLRSRLGVPPQHPRPNSPVHILGDQPDDAKRERVSAPSDATGLPTRLHETEWTPDAPAPPPDYRRRPPSGGVDRGGIGRGTVPTGGFKVR